jgi:hypothetical protein
MWRTLVAKEMRAHLVSFRFLATFVILFVVVVGTVAVLTGDYIHKLDEFSAGPTPTSTASRTSCNRPSRPSPSSRSSGA